MNPVPLARPAFLAILLAAAPAAAAPVQSFRSEYSVSIYGLTIARSSFESRISSDRFDVRGSLSSAGIASIFDDTDGTTATSGVFGRDATQPAKYVVDYTSGKKKKHTSVLFRAGSVAKAENVPPVNTKREGWIPLEKSHLVAVADPIAATLVRAGSLRGVCDRTIRIFDGAMRADLKLSYAETKPVAINGYEGEAVRCSARFVPIAGYRKGYRSIEYVKNSRAISVTFAPLGETGVYAPVEASVGTKIGTVTVRARRFETLR